MRHVQGRALSSHRRLPYGEGMIEPAHAVELGERGSGSALWTPDSCASIGIAEAFQPSMLNLTSSPAATSTLPADLTPPSLSHLHAAQ